MTASIRRILLPFLFLKAIAYGKRMLDRSKPDGPDPEGYKQVNNLLSVAYKRILTDGTLENIERYNGGFGGPFTNTYVDPNTCTRTFDRNDKPVGILEDAIKTGIFKWCFSSDEVGDAQILGIGNATKDSFFQGVKAGQLYGVNIDIINSLTIAMSLILEQPLCPRVYIFPPTEKGIFYDYVDTLRSGKCYATISNWFRHPYREQVVDFTCPIYKTAGYAVYSVAGKLNLANVLATGGANVKFCYRPGTVQALLVARSFPLATLVDVISDADSLCQKVCDAVVDGTLDWNSTVPGYPNCKGVQFDSLGITNPSSGTGSAAFTLRADCSAN